MKSETTANIEKVDRKVQTKLRVYPIRLEHLDTEVLVVVDEHVQTAATLDPNLPNTSIYPLLAFVPYQEIQKQSIRVVDLPRKALIHFTLPGTGQKVELPQVFSKIELSSSFIITKEQSLISFKLSSPKIKMAKDTKDSKVQTKLRVAPHILEEDVVAKVYTDLAAQTSLTFKPNASKNDIVELLQENFPHRPGELRLINRLGSIQFNDAGGYGTQTDNLMPLQFDEAHDKILNIIDGTVNMLEARLDDILKIYGSSAYADLPDNLKTTTPIGDEFFKKVAPPEPNYNTIYGVDCICEPKELDIEKFPVKILGALPEVIIDGKRTCVCPEKSSKHTTLLTGPPEICECCEQCVIPASKKESKLIPMYEPCSCPTAPVQNEPCLCELPPGTFTQCECCEQCVIPVSLEEAEPFTPCECEAPGDNYCQCKEEEFFYCECIAPGENPCECPPEEQCGCKTIGEDACKCDDEENKVANEGDDDEGICECEMNRIGIQKRPQVVILCSCPTDKPIIVKQPPEKPLDYDACSCSKDPTIKRSWTTTAKDDEVPCKCDEKPIEEEPPCKCDTVAPKPDPTKGDGEELMPSPEDNPACKCKETIPQTELKLAEKDEGKQIQTAEKIIKEDVIEAIMCKCKEENIDKDAEIAQQLKKKDSVKSQSEAQCPDLCKCEHNTCQCPDHSLCWPVENQPCMCPLISLPSTKEEERDCNCGKLLRMEGEERECKCGQLRLDKVKKKPIQSPTEQPIEKIIKDDVIEALICKCGEAALKATEDKLPIEAAKHSSADEKQQENLTKEEKQPTINQTSSASLTKKSSSVKASAEDVKLSSGDEKKTKESGEAGEEPNKEQPSPEEPGKSEAPPSEGSPAKKSSTPEDDDDTCACDENTCKCPDDLLCWPVANAPCRCPLVNVQPKQHEERECKCGQPPPPQHIIKNCICPSEEDEEPSPATLTPPPPAEGEEEDICKCDEKTTEPSIPSPPAIECHPNDKICQCPEEKPLPTEEDEKKTSPLEDDDLECSCPCKCRLTLDPDDCVCPEGVTCPPLNICWCDQEQEEKPCPPLDDVSCTCALEARSKTNSYDCNCIPDVGTCVCSSDKLTPPKRDEEPPLEKEGICKCQGEDNLTSEEKDVPIEDSAIQPETVCACPEEENNVPKDEPKREVPQIDTVCTCIGDVLIDDLKEIVSAKDEFPCQEVPKYEPKLHIPDISNLAPADECYCPPDEGCKSTVQEKPPTTVDVCDCPPDDQCHIPPPEEEKCACPPEETCACPPEEKCDDEKNVQIEIPTPPKDICNCSEGTCDCSPDAPCKQACICPTEKLETSTSPSDSTNPCSAVQTFRSPSTKALRVDNASQVSPEDQKPQSEDACTCTRNEKFCQCPSEKGPQIIAQSVCACTDISIQKFSKGLSKNIQPKYSSVKSPSIHELYRRCKALCHCQNQRQETKHSSKTNICAQCGRAVSTTSANTSQKRRKRKSNEDLKKPAAPNEEFKKPKLESKKGARKMAYKKNKCKTCRNPWIYKGDVDYEEPYIKVLRLENIKPGSSQSIPSLEYQQCAYDSIEMPWDVIQLPDITSYQLKEVDKHVEQILSPSNEKKAVEKSSEIKDGATKINEKSDQAMKPRAKKKTSLKIEKSFSFLYEEDIEYVEPYMEELDDEFNPKPSVIECTSKPEMPWENIVIPQNVYIPKIKKDEEFTPRCLCGKPIIPNCNCHEQPVSENGDKPDMVCLCELESSKIGVVSSMSVPTKSEIYVWDQPNEIKIGPPSTFVCNCSSQPTVNEQKKVKINMCSCVSEPVIGNSRNKELSDRKPGKELEFDVHITLEEAASTPKINACPEELVITIKSGNNIREYRPGAGPAVHRTGSLALTVEAQKGNRNEVQGFSINIQSAKCASSMPQMNAHKDESICLCSEFLDDSKKVCLTPKGSYAELPTHHMNVPSPKPSKSKEVCICKPCPSTPSSAARTQSSPQSPCTCSPVKPNVTGFNRPKCSCTDAILKAIEAYHEEMKPLKEALNKLREKIRDLNLPETNALVQPPSIEPDFLDNICTPCNMRRAYTTFSSLPPNVGQPYSPYSNYEDSSNYDTSCSCGYTSITETSASGPSSTNVSCKSSISSQSTSKRSKSPSRERGKKIKKGRKSKKKKRSISMSGTSSRTSGTSLNCKCSTSSKIERRVGRDESEYTCPFMEALREMQHQKADRVTSEKSIAFQKPSDIEIQFHTRKECVSSDKSEKKYKYKVQVSSL